MAFPARSECPSQEDMHCVRFAFPGYPGKVPQGNKAFRNGSRADVEGFPGPEAQREGIEA